MDERIERLLTKAEDALDQGDVDTADGYRTLACHIAHLRRQEAKQLNRQLTRGDT